MAYRLGRKLIEEGIWKEYEGAEFYIARAGNSNWLKAQEELEKPYRKQIDRNSLPADKVRSINLKAVATGVLLDWRHVEDEDGKAKKYTPELGAQAFRDDPELLEFVTEVALDIENYRVERVDEISKK